MTPREVRMKLNEIEDWYRGREEYFSPEDQVYFRALFEQAGTATHAAVLAGQIKESWRAIQKPQPQTA